MVELPDYEVLDVARRRSGLSLEGLWIRYFALGGDASHLELEGFLTGALVPNRMQRDLVAHVINEAFMDKGRSERVAYFFEGRTDNDEELEKPS